MGDEEYWNVEFPIHNGYTERPLEEIHFHVQLNND